MKKQYVTLTVNGREYRFSIGDGFGQVPPSETLSQTLRKRLELTGSKESCSEGACGCCTVLMDGKGVTSCMVLTVECDGKNIVTIEGLEDPDKGLDPLQQAFIDEYAFQCGYCTPGIIMAAKSLLLENPHPLPRRLRRACPETTAAASATTPCFGPSTRWQATARTRQPLCTGPTMTWRTPFPSVRNGSRAPSRLEPKAHMH